MNLTCLQTDGQNDTNLQLVKKHPKEQSSFFQTLKMIMVVQM
jgi:hypothetical protein